MIQITDKTMCSGCHSCYNACPQNCITMIRDEEGFLYPKVDETRCVDCNLCKKACQAIYPIQSSSQPIAYAAYNKDAQIREKSSSGGVFTLLAEYIIQQGGTVFGAAFDENFAVKHIGVDTIENLDCLRGSKYLQSRIGDTFVQAEALLQQGKPVLFTGTPCQIDGLLHYLKKPYPTLYTQDLICHGVPSPDVWMRYVEYRETMASSKALRIFFRHKRYGWKKYSVLFEFANETEYQKNPSEDLFMQGFLANLYLRPSCYHCSSKTIHRNSDITLADFWGIENIVPELFDDKGTSLVLVHTTKGKELLDAIQKEMVCKKVDATEALQYNPSASQSVARPVLRDEVLMEIMKNRFSDKYIKYLKQNRGNGLQRLFKRVVSKAKRTLKCSV